MSTSPSSKVRKGARIPSRGRSGSPSPKGNSKSRSPSPTSASASSGFKGGNIGNFGNDKAMEKAILKMLQKASIDDEDYSKSIKIPVFSDGTEWEAVVFELEVNLEKVWKYSSEMDIVDYLQGFTQNCDQEFIDKADKMIYYALVTAAKRDSFARKQIMASRHVDAIPRVERNEGLKLFNLFQSIFLNKSTSQANLPNAQTAFYQMAMNKKESAKEYIARVDTAVSDLAILNEKVSINSWLFIMAKGLRPEFKKCKDGVNFAEKGFQTIPELKAMIMKEETILGISKPESNKSSDSEIATAAFEGVCNHCNKKGHKKADCFKFKKEKEAKYSSKEDHWCDFCCVKGHTTNYCFWNPANKTPSKGKGKAKGKTKGKGKGKSYGKGKGKGKGKAKGGRGNGNFPASYAQEEAYYTEETSNSWKNDSHKNWDTSVDLSEESSTPDWQDYNFSIFEKDEESQSFILREVDTESKAWIHNNMWTQQDFEICTRGDHPTFAAAQGGPECIFLLNDLIFESRHGILEIKRQLQDKIIELKERKAKGDEGIWMYLDSGASRSVIQEQSPIRPLLSDVSETKGSCNVGNGANLKYLEKGMITDNNEVTVVKGLKYDLYAAVAAAKRGVSCVLDFEENGENKSYLFDKKSGVVTPLIERKKGILEVPIHLYVGKEDKGLTAIEPKSTVKSTELTSA